MPTDISMLKEFFGEYWKNALIGVVLIVAWFKHKQLRKDFDSHVRTQCGEDGNGGKNARYDKLELDMARFESGTASDLKQLISQIDKSIDRIPKRDD